MSFRRSKSPSHLPTNNSFAEEISKIADAQNPTDDIKRSIEILGITQSVAEKMMLSTDHKVQECVHLLKNLSLTLQQFPDNIPEQLQHIITDLRERIANTPITDDSLPAYWHFLKHPDPIHIINDPDFEADNGFYANEKKIYSPKNVTLIYVDVMNIKEDACPICLCELKDKEKTVDYDPGIVVALQCNHQYHVNCINTYFESVEKPLCPLCKKEA